MQKLAAINTGSTGSNTLFTNSSTIFWKVSNNFDISSDFTQAVASPINAASTSAVITFMTGGISIFSRFSGNAFSELASSAICRKGITLYPTAAPKKEAPMEER